jgi:hypothetical protein
MVFRSTSARPVAWLGMALALSCQSPTNGDGSTVPGKCSAEAPSLGIQKTDILFIVDNSESMTDKQAEVARELPAFVQVLQQQNAGVQQDFQIGLVTTSVYQNVLYNDAGYYIFYAEQAGRLQPVPDGLPDGGVVLGTGTERILSGSDPDLLDKFSRLVRVGITGSGQETPFEAMRLATTVWNDVSLDAGGNQGFLRDGAQLLAITVMDEDDCSEFADVMDAGWRPQVFIGIDKNRAPNFTDYCTLQSAKLAPPAAYYNVFQGLVDSTGALRNVVWADIGPVSLADKTAEAYEDLDAGTLRNVDCPISFGAGYRHLAMAELFDPGSPPVDLNDLDSICDENYHADLVGIAERAVANQSVQVYGVPDPSLLVVDITRDGGAVQACTTSGTTFLGGGDAGIGLIVYDQTPSGQEYVEFRGSCERRFDDTGVDVELFCVN